MTHLIKVRLTGQQFDDLKKGKNIQLSAEHLNATGGTVFHVSKEMHKKYQTAIAKGKGMRLTRGEMSHPEPIAMRGPDPDPEGGKFKLGEMDKSILKKIGDAALHSNLSGSEGVIQLTKDAAKQQLSHQIDRIPDGKGGKISMGEKMARLRAMKKKKPKGGDMGDMMDDGEGGKISKQQWRDFKKGFVGGFKGVMSEAASIAKDPIVVSGAIASLSTGEPLPLLGALSTVATMHAINAIDSKNQVPQSAKTAIAKEAGKQAIKTAAANMTQSPPAQVQPTVANGQGIKPKRKYVKKGKGKALKPFGSALMPFGA